MWELLLRIVIALSDVEAAAHTAALAVGHPGMEPVLLRICKRESRCRAVRIHEGDAGHSERVYNRAVAVGWLRPWCQPHGDGGWSTRGPWGLMAAYHVRLLGPCVPKWALDVPLVSAIAAARSLAAHCARPDSSSRTASGRRRKSKHPAAVRWAGEGGCDWMAEENSV